MSNIFPDPKTGGPRDLNLSPDEVKELHSRSDVDSSHRAQHHTLGDKSHQAAAGDHTHGNFIGELKMSATATSPNTKWIKCDGAAISRTNYKELFAAIGTTYGAGDGSTTFNLPDLRSRFPVGAGTFAALGGSDGLAEASRTTVHNHTTPNHTHTDNFATANFAHNQSSNTTLTGGGIRLTDPINHSHSITGGVTSSGAGTTGNSASNDVPYLAINFFIRAFL